MKYIGINKACKILGKTPQTLRNWDKSGFLKPAFLGKSGYRFYTEEQLSSLHKKQERITVGYCRVSSKKQSDDLERQVEAVRAYLLSGGKPFEIIADIGSGINYEKKGLKELIKKITDRQVSKIVVLYKDRLVRFGFELIKQYAELFGTELEIIDQTEKTKEMELVEDLVQIITVFSCKLQGQRANKAKQLIKELKELKENV